jgi:hypothetical protein
VRSYKIAKSLGKLQLDSYLATFSKELVDLPGARVITLPERYYATFTITVPFNLNESRANIITRETVENTPACTCPRYISL